MEIWKHFIVSVLLFIIFYPFFGSYALFVFVGGILIDIDHILVYASRFKRIDGPFEMYYFFRRLGERKNSSVYKESIRIFHNIETSAILSILSIYSKAFLLILIGLIVHLLMDMIFEKRIFGRLYNYSLLTRILK